MNHVSSETFRENAKAALADVHLRGALKNATSLFGERRREAAAGLPNWEDLRNQARTIQKSYPIAKYSGTQKLIEAEGAPVSLPTAPTPQTAPTQPADPASAKWKV